MSNTYVYMVIDDYTPDAGSTIYGIFATQELADAYVSTGIKEDFGEDIDTSSVNVCKEFLITK